MIPLSKSPSNGNPIVTPLIVAFILAAINSAIIGSPSTSLIINIGIVTWSPTTPAPIAIGSPGTLLTIITATAPSF